MNDDQKARTAEGALLQQKLRDSGLSARKAAEAIGLSDARLRHIMSGYQPVGRGQRIEVEGSASTLATIGLGLGVTPEEFDAVGRTDAGDALRARLIAVDDEKADEGDPLAVFERRLEDLLDDVRAYRRAGRRGGLAAEREEHEAAGEESQDDGGVEGA